MIDGLTRLFAEIKRADKLENLSENYKKFAEWLRIESVFHPWNSLTSANSPGVQGGSHYLSHLLGGR